jgi:hapalindole H/12-epi-hapalindole U/12-epi-fischerindole U synthase
MFRNSLENIVWKEETMRRTMLWLLAALLLAETAHAELLPIVNSGFETNFAAPGTFPILNPTGWSVLDPNQILDGNLDAVGVLNPTGTTYFPAGAPEGNNVALIYLSEDIDGGAVSLSQPLTSTLQPNTVYTLSVEVGNIASGFGPPPSNQFFDLDGFPGYSVQLLAGGVVLAEDVDSLHNSIPEGTFATSTIQFSSGASHSQLGQALEIRLTNLNIRETLENPGIEVDFDNVRLNATPVPGPSALTIALLGFSGFGMLSSRRRRCRK